MILTTNDQMRPKDKLNINSLNVNKSDFFNQVRKEIQEQSDVRRRDLSKDYSQFLYKMFSESSDITFEDLAQANIGEKSKYPTTNSGSIVATRLQWDIPDQLKFNASFSAGSILSKHYHSNAEEIMVIDSDCEGFFVFSFEGKDHLAEAGETVVIPAGVPHVVTYTAPRGFGKLTTTIKKIS